MEKEANLGKISKAVPVQVQGCTDTSPSCTGTPQQNATCTGTSQRCTGTCVLKMPRLCSFHVFKPKFIHR